MSKTIGNMTLKATPVGTDMVAIADSEDSDKTKKVLLSALSGGGSDMIHILDDTVTWSNPTYSATCTGITQYEDGHFYLIKLPSISGTIDVDRKLDINTLGAKYIDYNYYSEWITSSNTQANILPETPKTCILLYRSSTDKFHLLDTTYSTYKNKLCFYEGHAYNLYFYNNKLPQAVSEKYTSTLSITIAYSQACHTCYKCSTALSSLTIQATNPSPWETEIQFTTSSTFSLTVTGANLKWLGDAAPTFDPNTPYVIAIKNGYGVCSKVVP